MKEMYTDSRYKNSHKKSAKIFAKARKKLFSQIDSLSALADTMDEKFPYRTEPKGSDICCKKFLFREK